MDLQLRKEILDELFSLEDKDYKEFNKKLIPNISGERIIGIRMPQIKKFAKAQAKLQGEKLLENILETFENGNTLYYEECVIAGLLISYIYKDFEKWKEKTERFVPIIDNWAVCDVTCSSMKIVEKHREEAWEFLKSYTGDNREYYIRFGVVMLMCHFVQEEYIDEVLKELARAKTDDYYAMMGVAWAISMCYVKFPENAMKLIEAKSLDKVAHNKAIQKIRESNRVDKETKKKLLEYKRI